MLKNQNVRNETINQSKYQNTRLKLYKWKKELEDFKTSLSNSGPNNKYLLVPLSLLTGIGTIDSFYGMLSSGAFGAYWGNFLMLNASIFGVSLATMADCVPRDLTETLRYLFYQNKYIKNMYSQHQDPYKGLLQFLNVLKDHIENQPRKQKIEKAVTLLGDKTISVFKFIQILKSLSNEFDAWIAEIDNFDFNSQSYNDPDIIPDTLAKITFYPTPKNLNDRNNNETIISINSVTDNNIQDENEPLLTTKISYNCD